MGAFLHAKRLFSVCGLSALACCYYPLPSDSAAETGSPAGGGLQTYDVRSGGVQDGNQAVIRGVLVTSPIIPSQNAFFVQDPAGGPNSGLTVKLAEGASSPALQVGDKVDLAGNVHAVGGRYELWLSGSSAVSVVGSGDPPVHQATEEPSSWESWLGAAVQRTDLVVAGCPDRAGSVAVTDTLPVGGPFVNHDLQRGDTISSVTAVVAAIGGGHQLWPRSSSELQLGVQDDGCTVSIVEARAAGVEGAVLLSAAVLSAGPTGGGTAWVQDPGGGIGAGLPVLGLPVGDPGDRLRLRGQLGSVQGRLALDITAVRIDGRETPVAAVLAPVPDTLDPWLGGLVLVPGVTVIGEGPFGSWVTDAGLTLTADLVSPLPLAVGDGPLTVGGVLDQWPDGTWVLVVVDVHEDVVDESGR